MQGSSTYLVHGGEGQPAAGLSLRQVQHGDDGRLSVVGGVSRDDQLGLERKVRREGKVDM
jgi:hypothetical protein